ncbi:hypothetical protein WN093_02060 [Gammaproteobacteria bacterium AS21]
MRRVTFFFTELARDIFNVTFTLFKVMIPILIVIKVLEEFGAIILLSEFIAPLMQSVGLPSSMGLVWATTLLTNIYGGLIVLVSLDTQLSVAQASVLGSMMLLAHSLPIEAAIAKKAGVSLWITLLVRIGGSLVLAWLLHNIYQSSGVLAQPAQILWTPDTQYDPSYMAWALDQLVNLVMVFVVIAVLLFSLKILKLLGIEKLMAVVLRPFLRLLNIGDEAINLTIIGITLGLSFGGGLLINEARKGHIKARDIFTAIMLLNLLHSLIEDTLLILLIGADFNTIFWGRLVFSLVVVALINGLLTRLSSQACERFFYKNVALSKG